MDVQTELFALCASISLLALVSLRIRVRSTIERMNQEEEERRMAERLREMLNYLDSVSIRKMFRDDR